MYLYIQTKYVYVYAFTCFSKKNKTPYAQLVEKFLSSLFFSFSLAFFPSQMFTYNLHLLFSLFPLYPFFFNFFQSFHCFVLPPHVGNYDPKVRQPPSPPPREGTSIKPHTSHIFS
ncbi:hypothetical protein, unlikely [Trypanosoma brucei gambiense DAL972]|uniref:Uncharacterized protein n=1 Tax=Trypanosoma brucei gambiense (strain MHOM/CI/86/DAL972) TaxID=679716 RepID=C9ZQV9_TRYB9|nr:hypothetical protein, unlikely [Trypanosoma brucei gambiense DAL972]CBH11789.1 hypothetical protein, unlikely [Trypanosoma brucei gambiense DAL972]|eukprot:XP_011774074.1 hypothetical protein, unlikely [Trypanosoma brucei gambiense DAL972]